MKRMAFHFILSLVLTLVSRLAAVAYLEAHENSLTNEMCNFVSLPLETGALRDVFEGLETGLRRSAMPGVCVGVVDNGRSFSPDCLQDGIKYRTTTCKAQANTGVRATISYPARAVFDWWLLALMALYFALGFGVQELARRLSQFLALSFSQEIIKLLRLDPAGDAPESQGPIFFMMDKLGIRKILQTQALVFSSRLQNYETEIAAQVRAKAKLEEQTRYSHQYFEKVQKIRHNIRSPLTSLMAIQETLAADSDSAKRLSSAIRRIQLFMDDLTETDPNKETPSLVIAEVAIEEVAFLMQEKFQDSKSARIFVVYDHRGLSPIFVGKNEFSSVIENLLENSLEAISNGGQATVRIENDNGNCKISVGDDGSGISPDAMARLFTHGGTYGKLGGSGLGLHGAKQCVESWKGQISASNSEVGAVFSIILPVMQTGVQFVGLDSADEYWVIDDDETVVTALKSSGFTIVGTANTFTTGAGLLASLPNNSSGEEPVVLIDYRLGDGFGTDLITTQARRRTVRLCTNDYDNLELIKKAREIGVRIVPKPLCFYSQAQGVFAAPANEPRSVAVQN